MIWYLCFAVSAFILCASVLYAVLLLKKYRSGMLLTPVRAIFAGIFLAVFVGLVPMFVVILKGEPGYLLKLFIYDILQTIQVFTINVGSDLILDHINSSATAISGVYSTYMTCLFFVAPILTFGFLVSLLKNVLADLFYKLHFWGDVYAFSELNEKSLMLAQSIRSGSRKALIVFANVDRDGGDAVSEHIEAARELKAIVYQKDIVTVNFMRHSKNAQLTFFAIGDREGDNLVLSLKLLEKYRTRKNTGLYVFSAGAEGELLLANAQKGEIRVRRVNEVRSVIYQFLYDEGHRIFESACPCGDGRKEINAVIAGLGTYGTEMLKALTWYAQMDGYSLTIDAFDRCEQAEQTFSALCPELMSPQYNGVHIPGESEYTIRIHSGIDVKTKAFADRIAALRKTTFVFVCLGDDAENIQQAANIRMLCERTGSRPLIKTVVHSSDEKEALAGIRNYRGQPYGIEAIGDLKSTYSEEILLGSELEKLALARHLKWGREEEFWQYEYNYRSSMASAIHMKARIACGFSFADKEGSALTEEERNTLERLEHRRWNTYLRSEGYVYSGSPDSSSRNDLAKMHHNLVDFASLSEEDKRKDSSVGTL